MNSRLIVRDNRWQITANRNRRKALSESGFLLFVHRFPQERRIVSRGEGTYDARKECGSSAPAFEVATEPKN
jgi:hypothetical protein